MVVRCIVSRSSIHIHKDWRKEYWKRVGGANSTQLKNIILHFTGRIQSWNVRRPGWIILYVYIDNCDSNNGNKYYPTCLQF